MKRLLLTSTLILPFLTASVLAQEAPTPEQTDPPVGEQTETMPADTMDMDPPADDAGDMDAEADAEPAGETIVQQQAANELRVDWITGTTVYSRQDENIGRIDDLIIDQDSHAITAAILSVGGFLGMGAKQIAVRFDELEIDFDAREIYLNLTRDQADAAPEYVFRERTDAPAPVVTNGADAPLPPLD
ncbi:PRC-barrel domain-containing protein [Roseinatronobacter alkalisoli]|uniref:PRC-barrel domain-containing protein n=1 Tax=Roseinatronobacter alkalisoli TaxID=3028235 RepID=A0ABT5T7B3_9RHOB|nr:PRC-barrel domain-containing protein [Roseinatronobacter sp. HJB301]MDD7971018.1 PRC-barrel domain-containing protein [Roseinatronobacter sp. HJB301]